MSLRNKINTAVDKAFLAVGDLVQQGKLSSKAVSGFDFASGEVTSRSSTAYVDVIVTVTNKPSGEGYKVEALMKSGVDLSIYDTLTVDNNKYNIADYADDGFVIKVNLVREKT